MLLDEFMPQKGINVYERHISFLKTQLRRKNIHVTLKGNDVTSEQIKENNPFSKDVPG